MVLSKVWQGIHFYIAVSLAKVKTPPLKSPKLGIMTPLERSFNILKCQKSGKTSNQNEFLKYFKG